MFGIPIEINLSFLILLGIVFVWQPGIAGLLFVGIAFASVVLHELGHALVGRHLGVHTSSIELGFLGGAARMVNLPRTPNHEIAIALAGPAVSVMLGGIGLGLGFALGSPLLFTIGWINLILAAFNLIPALPMDGGRVLRAALARRFRFVRATDIAVTVSRGIAIAFAVIGLMGVFQLLIIAPFLWLMGTRERLMARLIPDGPYDAHDDAYGRMAPDPWRGVHREDHGAPDPWHRSSFRRGGRRFTIVRRNGAIQVIELND
ncbi:MAG: site-2 protease family protein [Kofleriaceae bacterium]